MVGMYDIANVKQEEYYLILLRAVTEGVNLREEGLNNSDRYELIKKKAD
jgi:hypothetical protein